MLQYTDALERGDLGEIRASWRGQDTWRALAGGGARFAVDREVEGLLNTGGVYRPREPKAVVPDKAELIDCVKKGDSVMARWRVQRATQSAEVAYTFRLWGKSLVVDVYCSGGQAGEMHAGAVEGAVNAAPGGRALLDRRGLGRGARPACRVGDGQRVQAFVSDDLLRPLSQ